MTSALLPRPEIPGNLAGYSPKKTKAMAALDAICYQPATAGNVAHTHGFALCHVTPPDPAAHWDNSNLCPNGQVLTVKDVTYMAPVTHADMIAQDLIRFFNTKGPTA